MKKLLLAGIAVLVVACADTSTEPVPIAPPQPALFDSTFTCRSGYVIAYMEDGTPYCVPEGGTMSAPSGDESP